MTPPPTQTVPKGYKQTEVGVIPEDWEALPLQTVCTMKSGKAITSAEINDYAEYPCYGGNGTRGKTATKTHSGDYALIGRQGALCGNVLGVSGDFYASEHAVVVSSNPDVGISWLTHMLKDLELNRYSESSAQPGLSVSKVLKLLIRVPPTKNEQEAIAEALGDADAWIESLEKLINKKRLIKQGAMQELLTAKRRLPGFEGAWVEKRLGDLGKCIRGVSYNPTSDLKNFDTQETIRLLRSNNVQGDKIEFENLQYVVGRKVKLEQVMQSNDILICMANGSKDLVGKAGSFSVKNNEQYTFGAFMGVYRPDPSKININFAFRFFYTERYRKHIEIILSGSSINNLNPGSIESLDVLLPMDPKEQTAIAAVLSDMDAEIEALEAKLEKARRIKEGMMAELLTGKTRLVSSDQITFRYPLEEPELRMVAEHE